MLDENLPTFWIKESKENVKQNSTIFLTRSGEEPVPAYSIRHFDPTSPAAKNCYDVVLSDSYNPEVIFAEVLVRPEWTQHAGSQDAVRANGGVPPAPEPTMPTEFTIQLYNPDQQVVVSLKQGGIIGSPHWDFSMPQSTFRAPSTSKLDMSQNDPTASQTTTQLNFSWKRERLSKDLTCVMTGKSTDVVKKKHKEPDITVAIFKGLREITIYEPNLSRVEMEDPKGLEVVLLLGAVVVRDVWFGNMRNTFNLSDGARRSSAGSTHAPTGGILSKISTISPHPRQTASRPLVGNSGAAVGGLYSQPAAGSTADPIYPNDKPSSKRQEQPPPADPRTQWEIDAETARLKAQADEEQRALRRQREKSDEAETRRLKKVVEAEQKEQRRKQEAIDRETARLRKEYGQHTLNVPVAGPGGYSAPLPQSPFQRPHTAQGYYGGTIPNRPQNAAYIQPPQASGGLGPPAPSKKLQRRSIWGLRSQSDRG